MLFSWVSDFVSSQTGKFKKEWKIEKFKDQKLFLFVSTTEDPIKFQHGGSTNRELTTSNNSFKKALDALSLHSYFLASELIIAGIDNEAPGSALSLTISAACVFPAAKAVPRAVAISSP